MISLISHFAALLYDYIQQQQALLKAKVTLVPKKIMTYKVWKGFGYKKLGLKQTIVTCKQCHKMIMEKGGNTTDISHHISQREPEIIWGECNSLFDVRNNQKDFLGKGDFIIIIIKNIVISKLPLNQHGCKSGKQHWEKATAVISRDVTQKIMTDTACWHATSKSTFVAVFAMVIYSL